MLKLQKKLGTFGALGVVVFLLTLAAPFTAGAAPRPDTTPSSALASQYQAAVKTLDPYVTVVDNRYVLAAPASVLAQVDPATLASLESGIAQTNAAVASDNLTINPATRQAAVAAPNTQAVQPLSTTGGRTKVVLHWWGVDLYLSGSMVRYIVIAGVGAAVVAVAAILDAASAGLGTLAAYGAVCAVLGAVAGDHHYYARIVGIWWIGAVRYCHNQ